MRRRLTRGSRGTFRLKLTGLAAAVLLVSALPHVASAADTDTILLRNGDRISGEVKSLDKGRLQVSTNSLGTIYVEWDKVVGVIAVGMFEVETTSGTRYVGRPTAADSGRMGLALDTGNTVVVDIMSVVRMRTIKDVWWKRLSGGINLGASYTQSSGVGQFTLSSHLTFRRPAFEISTAFDETVSIEDRQLGSTRTSWRSAYYRLLPRRWYIPGIARFERNPDLGYNLRATLGGGVGRFLIQSNKGSLGAGGGFVYNRETPLDGDDSHSVEAFLAALASFHRYDSPKASLDFNVAGFPSLSDGGRFRLELNGSFSYEILADFTVGLTVYDSYDNRPPQEGALKNDVGLSLSIGWTF